MGLVMALMLHSSRIRPFIDRVDSLCIYTQKPLEIYDCEHVIPRSFIQNKKNERDLHNIFKCNRHINRSRQNKPFTDDMAIQPLTVSKSIVARTCLYYIDHYNPNLDDFFQRVINETTLTKWQHLHDITEHEVYRNYEIFKVQGWYNPYIEHLKFHQFFFLNTKK
jgi:endonuclease I